MEILWDKKDQKIRGFGQKGPGKDKPIGKNNSNRAVRVRENRRKGISEEDEEDGN